MRLKTVFIRFYKSFNFDYLRKNHPNAKSRPWEIIDDAKWYPYVRIPIDPNITAVVGANESGKSHLLSAIEKGISGEGINRSQDFCRYSPFFKLEQGKLKWPDIGFEWDKLSGQERKIVCNVCGLKKDSSLERFFLFRTNKEKINIYTIDDVDSQLYEFQADEINELLECIPHVFRIDANVGLPSSVPVRSLIKRLELQGEGSLEALNRRSRFDLMDSIFKVSQHFPSLANSSNPQSATTAATAISSEISPYINVKSSKNEFEFSSTKNKEIELVRDLIVNVANIDEEALVELYEALKSGDREGVVMGITQTISEGLAKTLNFPRWWVQDRDFRLHVDARDYDLVFTIVDRTGTHYSFDERSSGLKYFLSYYIQYRAYKPQSSNPEILLMDEPDAYLSSQAQQDLLKIFEAFSTPDHDTPPVQVIYVTHSPFLINKNHAERIRVLEKGAGEEGTRVVRDASKNHYEPLRSAFGAFVGETTFIGNCNLMVEGLADQILIAGASNHLRSLHLSKLETLDLNHVTIVPAGSASHIPYLVYLAIGRDIEKPAVIVLLDSDEEGNTAKGKLTRGGPNKVSIKQEYILQIGDFQDDSKIKLSKESTLIEIEDLIPLSICAEAIKLYLRDVCEANKEVLSEITIANIKNEFEIGKTLFDALEKTVEKASDSMFHIEKVGFARNVISVVHSLSQGEGTISQELSDDLIVFKENFRLLLKRLRKMQTRAEQALSQDRISHRIDRAKNRFLQDNPINRGAKKEEAVLFLEELESKLDDSLESESIRLSIQKLSRDFDLDIDSSQDIEQYPSFIAQIEKIRYAGLINSQDMEPYEWE